ncbi:ATP-binding cassette domain-containing protein [Streptomyces durmitorensis]|uniref:ATP-binding cassette domain-containing protein n=1 Tax=Streptomyces durmitorensis TaxID=319947 RepID=A0ABY4PKC1_9ACTN|nr:ATP-binding cassette domain-containing protein [Streptomyces durmitorensis]UQT53795.1 ATP-binding cassette domain-containing protein [Streptomyces durmitorensis]
MRTWQEWTAAVRLLWRAGPRHTVALAVTVVCGALTGPLIVVATGQLVGELPGAVDAGAGSAAARRALVALIAFGALTLVRTGLRALDSGLAAVLRLRAAGVVEDRAIAAGTGPDGIGHLEEPGYADTLRLATEQGTRPDQLASLLPEIVRPRLEGIGLLVLLAPLAWWAPVLLGLAAVLTYRSYLRLSRQVHGSMESASAVIRRAGYLRSLAVDPEPAKEIRVFGLGDWLADRMTAVWQSGMATVWATRGKAARRAYGAVAFVVLAEGVVLGYAAFAAARGDLGLTQLVISAQAALALPALGWVGDDDLMVRDALLGLRSLVALELRGMADSRGRGDVQSPAGGDQGGDREGDRGGSRADGQRLPRNGHSNGRAPAAHGRIAFESVDFTYPGTDKPVLRGLDLEIPAGASVAIVGANGCGKTTLIKLLARLYEPDAGRITADGADVREYGVRQWRRGISVVFQDFVKYPLTLRDNVAMGAPDIGGDPGALERALELADGGELPRGLRAGWDTVLSRQFAGGADLSAGQWQRVAIARALLAARSGAVLVLDEPTAHLDARAEADFFDRFLTVSGGATTVLVSHRFSGVRRVGLIHVMDGGRIVESGTHDALMALGGKYARMYRLQAERFVDDDAESGDGDGAGAGAGAGARDDRGPACPPVGLPPVASVASPRPEDELPDDPGGGDPPQLSERGGRSVLDALRTLVAESFRESWKLAVLGLLLVPAAAGLAALQALWLRSMAEGAQQELLESTLTAALLLVVSLGVWEAVELAAIGARIGLSERVGFAFDRLLARIAAGIPGLRHQESPAFQDRLHLLRDRTLAMGALLNWVLNLLEQLGGFLVTAALLATVHPALLVLPLIGALALRLQISARGVIARAQEATAADYRLAARLARLATSPEAGKELRIFEAGPELWSRVGELRGRADGVASRAQWRFAAVGCAAGLLNSLGLIGAVAFVVHLAVTGHTSLGAVLLTVVLAGRFTGHVGGLVQATGAVVELLQSAERLRWLRTYAERANPAPAVTAASPTTASGTARAAVPSMLRQGIAVEGLTFRYPGTSATALRDVDLRLPAGGVVALVGENGSGKTTLVKLLCRMYEPTLGRITVDGVSLDALGPEQWRERLGAAFEDFVRFEFVLRETVGVGELSRIADPWAVVGALGRAGATDLPGTLPNGLESQLGSRWEHGTDLSTGQWQKLALARALMRQDPLLRILDEPTASLDAETEHVIFERYIEAARRPRPDGGRPDTVTLLVSHRFSTVRGADLIVVLDHGRVAETGTHEELLARGSLYAQMYGLQARAYL